MGTTKEKQYEGYAEGEKCNRDGCSGIIRKHDKDGGCSCHINPPCLYCETASEYCPVCEWDGYEEQQEYNKQVLSLPYTPFEPKPIEDDGKLYDVVRYFDDIFEAVEAKGLTKPVAYETMNRIRNSKPRYYVSFSVVETGSKR